MYTTEGIRHLSRQDFALLGLEEVAYIKAVSVEGRTVYAVHAADGRAMGMIDGLDVARAVVIQQDLEPLLVN